MSTDVVGVRDASQVLAMLVTLPARRRRTKRMAAEARPTGPNIEERQDALALFYTKYEDLVELLCDAAQYGPAPRLARQYSELKAWMQSNYPEIRPFLGAFLRPEEGLGDTFEALVAAPDLETFLVEDDGDMISRISRTREALNLYGEHLRQLAAKTA